MAGVAFVGGVGNPGSELLLTFEDEFAAVKYSVGLAIVDEGGVER